jgi:Flp pilus assembly protein TadG
MSVAHPHGKAPAPAGSAAVGNRGAGRPGRRQAGIASVEFALVATLLVYLMFAVVQFGWLLNNYAKIDSATGAAARYFASQVGRDTPRSQTVSNFNILMSGMGNVITYANLSLVTAVAGTTCTTDTACATALETASKVVDNGSNWADQRVTVTVTWNIAGDPTRAIFGQSANWVGLGNLVPAQRIFTASERVAVAR